jgi:hypothetical protein
MRSLWYTWKGKCKIKRTILSMHKIDLKRVSDRIIYLNDSIRTQWSNLGPIYNKYVPELRKLSAEANDLRAK